jgi:hypothetical protein
VGDLDGGSNVDGGCRGLSILGSCERGTTAREDCWGLRSGKSCTALLGALRVEVTKCLGLLAANGLMIPGTLNIKVKGNGILTVEEQCQHKHVLKTYQL